MANKNIAFWVKSTEKPNQSADANYINQHSPMSDKKYDVSIVGGGFTGLWLAYYLIKNNPELNIALFEAKQVGYGASGRNGGWLSTNLPGVIGQLLKRKHVTQDDIIHLQRKVNETIHEVNDVCQQESIDCDFFEGGLLNIATNKAQSNRLIDLKAEHLKYGFDADKLMLLTAEEAKKHINIDVIESALYYKQGARIQPFKLILGLKSFLEAKIDFFENTPVTNFKQGAIYTKDRKIDSDAIICCTEGYSGPLLGKRSVIPINSSIIATNVLPSDFWEKANWNNNELLGDLAHQFIYAQRTEDNRIIIGGRGAPYQYNAKTSGHGHLDANTQKQLLNRLQFFFPNYKFDVDYAWKGSLGVTRDWCPTVTYNPNSNVGYIYGFAGHGVGPTNLAARTMVDRILGKSTDLTKLPWNEHKSPKWEPEPFRWLAIHGMYKWLSFTDYAESKFNLKKSPSLTNFLYKLGGLG